MSGFNTVLTDLSANVFAALLLVVVVRILPQAHAAPTLAAHSGEVEQLGALVRAPMAADALVAFLYDRRPEAPGLSLDLTEAEQPDLGPVLRNLDAEGPVRLYVFSHRHYRVVSESLRRSRVRWIEVSVPSALGGPATSWSSGFRDLLSRRLTLPAFRAELARLLAGARASDLQHQGARQGAAPLQRLRQWLETATTVGALLLGFGAAVTIEAVSAGASARWPAHCDDDPIGRL